MTLEPPGNNQGLPLHQPKEDASAGCAPAAGSAKARPNWDEWKFWDSHRSTLEQHRDKGWGHYQAGFARALEVMRELQNDSPNEGAKPQPQ